MDKLLLYKDWLETFKREVDTEVARMRKAPAAAPPSGPKPLQQALESIRSWWDRAYEDPSVSNTTLADVRANRELDLSRKEVAALNAEVERLRGAQASPLPALHEQLKNALLEKGRLEEQLALAMREIAGLKDLKRLKGTVDQELGELRARMSAIRGECEGRIRILKEQAEATEHRAATAEADLREERERRLAVEKALEAERAKLAQAEALRAEVQAVRGEVQARLEAAAEFLEAKIRGVQEQSKGQGQQLRDVTDALRRLREG